MKNVERNTIQGLEHVYVPNHQDNKDLLKTLKARNSGYAIQETYYDKTGVIRAWGFVKTNLGACDKSLGAKERQAEGI